MHNRAQYDGEEADARRVAAAATARVRDHRERLDAMHHHVPPYRCGEAALLLPKDENPEKPWSETGVPLVVRPGAAVRPHAFWMDAIALRAYRHVIETVNRHLEKMGSERLPRGANAGFERKAP